MFYRTSFFVVTFFFSFSFSQFVSAQDYYWQIVAQGYSFSSASPRGTCDQYLSFLDSYSPKWKHSIKEMEKLADWRFRCVFQYNGKEGTDVAGGYGTDSIHVDRSGDSCPDGTTLNTTDPDLPTCVPPSIPNGEVCGPKDQYTGLPKIKNSAGECVDFPFADRPSQCKFAESRVRDVKTTVQFDSNGVPSGPPQY
jgi:hypothetical protein